MGKPGADHDTMVLMKGHGGLEPMMGDKAARSKNKYILYIVKIPQTGLQFGS